MPHLPSGCLGLASSLLLKDGQMTKLYEHVLKFPPGYRGPGGSRKQPFTFKNSFLNWPSPAATEAAQRLLAAARIDLRRLDLVHAQASADAVFLSLF